MILAVFLTANNLVTYKACNQKTGKIGEGAEGLRSRIHLLDHRQAEAEAYHFCSFLVAY